MTRALVTKLMGTSLTLLAQPVSLPVAREVNRLQEPILMSVGVPQKEESYHLTV
jgi:hypothetical protein